MIFGSKLVYLTPASAHTARRHQRYIVKAVEYLDQNLEIHEMVEIRYVSSSIDLSSFISNQDVHVKNYESGSARLIKATFVGALSTSPGRLTATFPLLCGNGNISRSSR